MWPGWTSHVVFAFWGRLSSEWAFQEEGSRSCQFTYVLISEFSEHDSCLYSIGRSSHSANPDQVEGLTRWGVGTCIQEVRLMVTVFGNICPGLIFFACSVYHVDVHIWRRLIKRSLALCLLHFHLVTKSWREAEAWASSRVIRFSERSN